MNKYKNKENKHNKSIELCIRDENKHNKSIELCIRDENNLIVAWQVGMSEEDIDKTLTLPQLKQWDS